MAGYDIYFPALVCISVLELFGVTARCRWNISHGTVNPEIDDQPSVDVIKLFSFITYDEA
jgi:hypothetical protein